jgi:hypothetical protein
MSDEPDFYLTSSEGYGLETPRACFRRASLAGRAVDGYLLVEVDPPLDGVHYGRPSENISLLVLATRHAGQSLFPISEWPLYVHVAMPTRDISGTDTLNATDLEHVGWGELYRTKQDAELALV